MPTFDDTNAKWAKIVALGNMYIRNWQNEPGVDWSSLYDPTFSFGTVTNTDSYDIDGSIRKISDRDGDVVRINWSDGVGYSDYTIVPHDDLKMYYQGQNKEYPDGYYCAQMGDQLVFNHKFISTDPEFGGTILVPIYTFADTIEADDDTIPVDNPDWLVTRVSAEYVRTDITRQAQYPNILAEANELMERMIDDNDAQFDQIEQPWRPSDAPWLSTGGDGISF